MFCKHCGKQIDESARFCKYCGRELTMKEKTTFGETKTCPFCNKGISFDYEECPYCKRLLIERVSSSQKRVADISQLHSNAKNSITAKLRDFFNKRGNYSKLIKYSFILLLIIFVVWIFSGDEQSYNEKSPARINESIEINSPKRDYNSLPSGTIIHSLSYYLTGSGELKIDNGTGYDTVVKLISISADKSIYTAYIKAKNSHKINKISDGRYKLLFMHGRDWDMINKTFMVDKNYSEFKDDFYFITRETTYYDEYSVYEITLHPVYGGTAKTGDISKNEFDKYK